jgi:hypothetical protein
MTLRATAITLLLPIVSSTVSAQALYGFTLNPALSGLDADVSLTATTAGNLIGNYDPNTNPTGTRTKPGVWGPFGETENLPVAVSFGGGLGGPVHTAPVGGFRMTLDPAAGIVLMSGFGADLLGGSPAGLTATVTLETESFRTRNPTSLYIGGVPIELPVGEAAISLLSVTQLVDDVPGTLIETGPNQYSFAVAPLVNLSAAFELLGTPYELPPAPVLFPLQGDIVLSGNQALLTSLQPLGVDITQPLNQELPQFPLDLPTIIPPGDIAHVLMNLTLQEVAALLDGTNALTANGLLIPEPATLWLAFACAGLRRRV